MFNLVEKIPRKVYLAFSGGKDSTNVLGFLLSGRKEVTLIHVSHGDDGSETHCRKVADSLGLTIHVHQGETDCRSSLENSWRDLRYKALDTYTDAPVIVAHHLVDSAETYLFSALHGNPKLIPSRRNNVIRPFLAVHPDELCRFGNLPIHTDDTNQDLRFARPRIRASLLPAAIEVHPGFLSTVRKMVLTRSRNQS